MSEKEKIEFLEEIMDLDGETLNPNSILAEFEEWDSLAALTYISEMDSRFGKKISGEQIKSLVTVADAITLME